MMESQKTIRVQSLEQVLVSFCMVFPLVLWRFLQESLLDGV